MVRKAFAIAMLLALSVPIAGCVVYDPNGYGWHHHHHHHWRDGPWHD